MTSVVYRKKSGEKSFIVADAGMNDLLRPSLYDAHHEVLSVDEDGSVANADLVGPVCESGDYLARDRELPDASEGDVLAIMDAGAYGFSMASNYNSRPRPQRSWSRETAGPSCANASTAPTSSRGSWFRRFCRLQVSGYRYQAAGVRFRAPYVWVRHPVVAGRSC